MKIERVIKSRRGSIIDSVRVSRSCRNEKEKKIHANQKIRETLCSINVPKQHYRTYPADTGVLSGVRRQVVWKTLRRLLLRRLLLFFQAERQEADRLHVYRYVGCRNQHTTERINVYLCKLWYLCV